MPPARQARKFLFPPVRLSAGRQAQSQQPKERYRTAGRVLRRVRRGSVRLYSTSSAQEQGTLRQSKHTAVRRNQKLPHACWATAQRQAHRQQPKERYRAAIREFCKRYARGVDSCPRPKRRAQQGSREQARSLRYISKLPKGKCC